jgi:UDP-N-acetylglucosamine 2-epimerase
MTVVGARPQFVKAAVVSRALRRRHREVLVHTGQHYDDAMSDLFFRELALPEPDHHLGVGAAPHGAQTGRMLERLEAVLERERPDLVLVFGDTNSTLAGALAASKLAIPVAHVEAGCRSHERFQPEEINRVATDHLSSLLFCSTPLAAAHLAKEGLTEGVHHVGDVMLDVLLERRGSAESALPVAGAAPGEYLVATVHRAENTDDPRRLLAILEALDSLDQPVIFPAHPRTRKAMAAAGWTARGRLRVMDPVGYLDMLGLVRHARMALTDSGGLQKEAFFLATPCLTLRRVTEWPETVDAGWNRLVDADGDLIRTAVLEWKPAGVPDVAAFGDGRAAERIVEIVGAWTR